MSFPKAKQCLLNVDQSHILLYENCVIDISAALEEKVWIKEDEWQIFKIETPLPSIYIDRLKKGLRKSGWEVDDYGNHSIQVRPQVKKVFKIGKTANWTIRSMLCVALTLGILPSLCVLHAPSIFGLLFLAHLCLTVMTIIGD